MSQEMMNTRELAAYLGINEKQVYALVKGKKLPATRVTGKWLFPRRLIDDWIEESARAGFGEARAKSRRIEGALLAAGSNDPVLDMLQTALRTAHPEFYLFSTNVGSRQGLTALNRRFTDIAWSHLLDPETGEYNLPFLPKLLPDLHPVVVNLFHRDLGLVVAAGNPLGIAGISDLAREGIRLINRQTGSGTRVLLDHRLNQAGIATEHMVGYDREVCTHFEVGLSVLSDDADVGLATAAVSHLLGLGFVPVARECFDMILDQGTFFQPSIQAFMGLLGSASFRERVEPLGGYDFSEAGKIRYASPKGQS